MSDAKDDLINSRVTKLEEKVTAINTTFRIIVAVAAIFGVGGAWGLKLLSEAKTRIDDAQSNSDKLEKRVHDLAGEVEAIGNPAELRKQIKREIDSSRVILSTGNLRLQ